MMLKTFQIVLDCNMGVACLALILSQVFECFVGKISVFLLTFFKKKKGG